MKYPRHTHTVHRILSLPNSVHKLLIIVHSCDVVIVRLELYVRIYVTRTQNKLIIRTVICDNFETVGDRISFSINH